MQSLILKASFLDIFVILFSLWVEIFVLMFLLVLVLLYVISGMLDILFSNSDGVLIQTLFLWSLLSRVSLTFFFELFSCLGGFCLSGFSSSIVLRTLFNSNCWSTESFVDLNKISEVINKFFCLISSLIFYFLCYLCGTLLKII